VEAPTSGGEVVDGVGFDFVLGLEALVLRIEEAVEILGGFGAEHDGLLSAEAMAKSVELDAVLAGLGFGPLRKAPVFTRRGSGSRHFVTSSLTVAMGIASISGAVLELVDNSGDIVVDRR
jgi:hypothetical protein